MPSRDVHLTRAEQNEQFARTLNLDDSFYTDWAIAILFYSALHYIDAYFALTHVHPRDHDKRDAAIEKNGTLTEIYRDYRRLKDVSEDARYDAAGFDRSKFMEMDTRFTRIKQLVQARIR